MIDWSKIETVGDLIQYEANLFDEAPDLMSFDRDWINPNLTKEEREDAEFWKKFKRGIWLLMAPPGQGKDMVATMVAYKFRKYFGLIPVLDYKPKRLFGAYVPFSTEMLVEQLDRMSEMATGEVRLPPMPKKKRGILEDEDPEFIEYHRQVEELKLFKPYVTEDGRWITSRGEVFIRNATIVLGEFDTNYMYRKEANKPITRTLLRLFTRWRHLNSVIIGQGTEVANVHSQCFPKITMEMTVRALDSEYPLFGLMMQPKRFVESTSVLIKTGRLTVIPSIDGGLPRIGTGICEELGELAWKDLFNTDQATFMEPPKSMRRKQ